MNNLTELAARVEGAEGPNRDIDAEIAPLTGLRMAEEGHPLGRCCYDQNGRGVPLPAFTASLDAALTLVPEGWFILVSDWQASILRKLGPWQAVLTRNRDDMRTVFDGRSDHAATPALALCAAALRARAAMEAGNG